MFYNLRRQLSRRYNSLAYRIDARQLTRTFDRIGLESGMTVCAHSALSQLGYVAGGPDLIVDALMERIGEGGCLMMPSYPTGLAMAQYLDSGEVFDARLSPSKVGVITELFRRRPGVHRSLHPTNPVCAWGRGAEELLCDHDKSLLPYGYETPFGRLSGRDDAYILMLNTHVHSYLHHLQVRVDQPNLHLAEERTALLIDGEGRQRQMRTKVMRPRVPYFVAIPAAGGSGPDWAVLHDFALLFPQSQERAAKEAGYRYAGYPKILHRRAEFERDGIFRSTRLGKGEVGLLKVKEFTARLEPEFRELIDRFRSHYDPDKIAALDLPYT